ncbi:MAG: M20/M25/M40 family metallo-hydrolase [Actinomycetota bacterium]|nr:M20/M25/M40 family metallo-hydrolase [Actinomycetota bacterium]
MRRILHRLLVVVVVLAASLWSLSAATPVVPVEIVDTSALRAAMTATRIRDHLVALDAIARTNRGTRAVGTSGYQASADYVRDRLNAAGYQVSLQQFQVLHFAETSPPTLKARRTYQPDTDVRTMTFSGSGSVTATVRPVDLTLPPSLNPSSTSGCEPADFAGFSRGALALMQRGGCSFVQKATNAMHAGAAAVLIMNEGQPDRQELISGSLVQPGLNLPVLGLSYSAGAELAGAPDTPVRVVTDVVSDYQQTVNVLADGPADPAGRSSDRVVMVGAHLDSVPEGPGVNDDGSGVAVVLELADQLARLPAVVPRNRIRFAFWGAEELGTLGSEHYVGQLTPEQLSGIAAYLNFDMLGSPNFVRYVYDGDGSSLGSAGPPGSDAVERIFGEYLSSQGLAYEPTEFDGRSDYAAFQRAGVPVGGLFSGAEERKTQEQAIRYGGTAGQPQDSCYHRACDTINNVSEVALEQLGDAAADATLRLLLSSTGPRQIS